MKLIALYRGPQRAPFHGWSFRPTRAGQEPACWAWVDDLAEVRHLEVLGCEMLVEPGRSAPRYPHELYYQSCRQEALPIEPGRHDNPGPSRGARKGAGGAGNASRPE